MHFTEFLIFQFKMDEYKLREAFEKVKDEMNELRGEMKKLASNYENLAIEVRKKKKK